jgi:oxygen-dependent protoporphyrinogen oxidase
MAPRVIVVGAGVAGLTAAYRLQQHGVDVTVLEPSPSIGSMCRNAVVGGFELPTGPDAFLARKPGAAELCRDLGLDVVAPRATGQYVWTASGLVAYPTGTAFGIPTDLSDAFRWPGLSRSGRARVLRDFLIAKRRGDDDESLGALLRRRLGPEATDRSLAPLLGALYGGAIDELSARATFPEFQEWERSQGSLLRGAQAASRNGRGAASGPVLVRPRGWLQAIPDKLASQLTAPLGTATAVDTLDRAGEGWRVATAAGTLEADAVVLTHIDERVASLLPMGEARTLLSEIRSVSVGTVLLVYGEGSASKFPDGSGFVVPEGEAPMYACTWLSQRWPDPAYGKLAILSCAIGGAAAEDVLDAPDDDLVEACARHLAALLPLPVEPEHALVTRWPHAMPRYGVGHAERVAEIRRALPPGIFVAGRSLDGVDLSDEVRSGNEAAESVVATLPEEAHP